MKINQDRLEKADRYVEELLKEYPDQRLQTGIKNVKRACHHHLTNGMAIGITSIAEFIRANCGGKPAKGTLDNDSKGVYKPIIDAYCEVALSPRKSNKQGESSSAIPSQIQIYIKQLENRNKHLEKILDKNFKNQGSISVDSMLTSQTDAQGSVDVILSSKFSAAEKKAIKNLLGLIELTNDFSFRGEEDRERILNTAGKVVLAPNDLILIKSIIGG
ncbi:hypothetical protein AB4552_16700 [Vibrio sp. 10N.222.54.C3]|uniref:Uncharacterized protein n=1 Tax=Vibrio kanaloae TaxID=170673 RepID=A0A4U1ZKH2_9VIBR|nr:MULTISPECIES: hypothetical protein [Vibrio]OEE81493.1 hypothetical protein OAI_11885 [Vibrio cyclitrophicus FF160]PMJ19680.1 hypothetical protein BCU28_14625 [Vibrio cyclitrophicus]TKF35090.1 hypothetical protein FCV50_04175 [Vibrio kanaloae]TKF75645.1 hypothetical protein FCV62_19710 [Vibrio kanaloae]